MRLNPDCIRDLLLTAEEHENMLYPGNFNLLDKYDRQEVIYHIKQCHMSELILVTEYANDGGYRISDLTPKGHELVSQIRPEFNWSKITKILLKHGCSISAIIQCATTICSSL